MTTGDTTPLEKTLPEGQIVDRAWLQKHDFDRPRVDAALRSQKLVAVVRGVYRRPGPPLKWEQVVYSLNQMGYPVRVGGDSALRYAGMAHYLNLARSETIHLHGVPKAPKWLPHHKDRQTVEWEYPEDPEAWHRSYFFEVHTTPKFQELPSAAVTSKPFGTWDWPVPHSTPELAFLEMLESLQDEADFEKADKTFEAAATLRPNLLNDVLAACRSVKAKRLLFWFGARHGHPWFADLDRNRVDLGKGKRMLVRGGSFDSQYEITVPKGMARGNEQPLY